MRPAPAKATAAMLCALCLLGGCQGGTKVSDVPTPYVRCMALPAPAAGSRSIGPVTAITTGRRLRLRGLPRPLRIAAFTEPGFGAPPSAARLASLAAAKPHLLIALGGLGDDQATADATAVALASLALPTLLLAGGRDSPERIARAVAAVPKGRERIIDVTGLRAVEIENDTFVPVAGAGKGTYATGPDACGHGLADLKLVADELGAPGDARRWLLAWHAPGGGGTRAVGRTERGLDVGAADLAELSRRIGAPGGLFAWPPVRVLRPAAADGDRELGPGATAADLRMVVPRLGDPPSERDDGSRAHAHFALLELGHHGLTWLSSDAPKGPSK